MASAWEDMVVVGRIARAQGNRGQVIVDPVTDFPEERFKAGSVLHIRRGGEIESLTIEDARFHRGRPVLDLAGVDSMNGAEELAGAELRIEPAALQPLPAGAYYHHDLIGCMVETPAGDRIGEVASVEGEPTGSRLVVRRGSAEILIPMVEGICSRVDIAGKKIIVEPPDGLLELNVTKRQKF
jgi:16S rRNA processing protein RimM